MKRIEPCRKTLKKVVDLYWRSIKADKHYGDSSHAKGLACALADEFHELMQKLRKEGKK